MQYDVHGLYYSQGSSGRVGRIKKNGKQSIGRSRGGLTTKIHVLAINEHTAYAFSLSGGQAHDCPEGKALLLDVGEQVFEVDLAADKAYPSENFRVLAEILNYNLISPPQSNLKEPWEYDKTKYRERNRIERLFGKIKRRFRRVHTRYDKLDIIYMAFVYLAFFVELLRVSVNTA